MGPGTPTWANAVPPSLGLRVLMPGFLGFPRLREDLASTGRKGGWRHPPVCRPGGGAQGNTSWEKRTGFKDTVCFQKSLVQGFSRAVGGRSPRRWELLPAALPALPELQAGSLPGDRGPGCPPPCPQPRFPLLPGLRAWGVGQWGEGPAPRAEGAERLSLQHLARGSSVGQEYPLPSRPPPPKTLNPSSQPSLFGVCLEPRSHPHWWASDTFLYMRRGWLLVRQRERSCSLLPAVESVLLEMNYKYIGNDLRFFTLAGTCGCVCIS